MVIGTVAYLLYVLDKPEENCKGFNKQSKLRFTLRTRPTEE